MATLFVTSTSSEHESRLAGKQVALQAVAKLQQQKPTLGILFCSSEHNYQAVLDGIKDVIGPVPLIGCSSAGAFTEAISLKAGIALALIASDSHKFFTGAGLNIKENEFDALTNAAAKFPDTVSGFPNLWAMLFIDGLAGKGEETVLAASAIFDEQVKFTGGAAADNLEFKETQVFCDDKSITDAVSICYTASRSPVIIKVGHGHIPITENLTVTKASGSILYELNNRPAADVWKEHLLGRAEVTEADFSDPKAFSRLLLKHEAGLVTSSGYKMRFPISCNADKSLNFVCTIAEGSVMKIMDSCPGDQIDSARKTALAAKAAAQGTKIAGAVIFDCACRGMILKDRFKEAVKAMAEALPGVPIIGAETYGEIAMEKGELSGFHNTTTVIALIPD